MPGIELQQFLACASGNQVVLRLRNQFLIKNSIDMFLLSLSCPGLQRRRVWSMCRIVVVTRVTGVAGGRGEWV